MGVLLLFFCFLVWQNPRMSCRDTPVVKCVVEWTDAVIRFVLISDCQRLESAPVDVNSL